MANLEKYKGVIPAFYACYDAEGNVSPERVRALTEYHIRKGVKGVYVNGSSGECIYQSLEDRKITLENVMAAAKGRLTVIAHVGCNIPKTAWNWQSMQRAWALTPSHPSRPSTSICRSMQLPPTGMP